MGVVIRDSRELYDRLLAAVKTDKKAHTKVGFQRKTGTKEKDSGVLVVDVAIANEFGTKSSKGNEHIPPRPFMRTYFDENKDKLADMCKKLYAAVLLDRLPAKKALAMLGEYAKAGIIKKIDEIVSPANAPATIKRKGSSKPLIDTGQMRQSITHEEVTGES